MSAENTVKPRSRFSRTARMIKGTSRQVKVCVIALLAIYVASLVARLAIPEGPAIEQNLGKRLEAPSGEFWLGTDTFGRDLMLRILLGIEVDLRAVFVAVLAAALVGVPIGIAVGMGPAWLDNIVMRIVDAFLSIPTLVIVLFAVAMLRPGLMTSMLGIAFSFSLIYIRLARSETLNLRQEPFLLSARQVGIGHTRLLGRHLLPTAARPLIIESAVLLRAGLLIEATLSYFGLSIQAPQPSLGSILREAQDVAMEAPWQVLPAGAVLMALVLLLNFTSDGISEHLSARSAPGRMLDSARGRLKRRRRDDDATGREEQPLAISGLEVTIQPSVKGPGMLVRGVSIDVRRGEVVALVGESGSGKTMTAMASMGLLPSGVNASNGTISVAGRNIIAADPSELREIRTHEIGVVFQDSLSSMNPVWTVEDHLVRPMVTLLGLSKGQAREKAVQLLEEVGIGDARERLTKYPHELSGGIAQRVMIAAALIGDPKVIVADEATSALDATVQVRVLDLLERLCASRNVGLMLITHSMGVVARIADRMFVMYSGQIVESGSVGEVINNPQHPYTQALLAAAPRNEARQRDLQSTTGSVPPPSLELPGCRFAERCDHAIHECVEHSVELIDHNGRSARCRLLETSGSGPLGEGRGKQR